MSFNDLKWSVFTLVEPTDEKNAQHSYRKEKKCAVVENSQYNPNSRQPNLQQNTGGSAADPESLSSDLIRRVLHRGRFLAISPV